jgi:hypothetical protein
MDGTMSTDISERLKIQEKALQDLADRLKKREAEFAEEREDLHEELKAIKIFLSRTLPDFKKQYPDIRKKLKAA